MASYVIKNVPDDLWKRFKLACTMEGTTMLKQLHVLILEYVERTGKKYGARKV